MLQYILIHRPPIVEPKLFNVISWDTVFTVGITLAIFILGIIVQKWFENRKENKNLAEIRKYLILQVGFLDEPLEKQIKFVKIFVDAVKKDLDQELHYDSAEALTTNRIDELSSMKIFNSIQKSDSKSDKVKLYQDLTNSLDLISGVKKNLNENIDFYNLHYKNYASEYQHNVLQASKLYDARRTSNEEDGVPINEDQFLQDFDGIMGRWSRRENYKDMYVADEHFLNPTKEMCRGHEGDKEVIQLLHLVNDAQYAIENIKHIRELVKESMEKEMKKLEGIRTSLKKSLEQLKS